MGIDLFAFPERRVKGRYEVDVEDRCFDWRLREMWAFLGAHESEIGIPPLAEARGIPADGLQIEPFISEGLFEDMCGRSWLSAQELLAFDYDTTFVGRFRVTETHAEGQFTYAADPEAATTISFRRFLGPGFFDELSRLAASGADRIVFFTA